MTANGRFGLTANGEPYKYTSPTHDVIAMNATPAEKHVDSFNLGSSSTRLPVTCMASGAKQMLVEEHEVLSEYRRPNDFRFRWRRNDRRTPTQFKHQLRFVASRRLVI
jgi:hypothetical protein